MKPNIASCIQDLIDAGWKVVMFSNKQPFPDEIRTRYEWLPDDVIDFMTTVDSMVSPDDKSWFITVSDLEGRADTAYAWNQWELDSLDGAEGDADWQREISNFWEANFPVLISVSKGYAYFAISRESHGIVTGREPEFEETQEISTSFLELLSDLKDRNSAASKCI